MGDTVLFLYGKLNDGLTEHYWCVGFSFFCQTLFVILVTNTCVIMKLSPTKIMPNVYKRHFIDLETPPSKQSMYFSKLISMIFNLCKIEKSCHWILYLSQVKYCCHNLDFSVKFIELNINMGLKILTHCPEFLPQYEWDFIGRVT